MRLRRLLRLRGVGVHGVWMRRCQSRGLLLVIEGVGIGTRAGAREGGDGRT